MADMVNNPPHYTNTPFGLEVIEITRHYGFDIGNALKYIFRAGKKGDDGRGNELGPLDSAVAEVRDLRKATWYIQDRIKMLQQQFEGWDLDDPYGRHHEDVVVSQADQTQAEGEGEPRVALFGVDEMMLGEADAVRAFVELNPGLSALLGGVVTMNFSDAPDEVVNIISGWDDTPGSGRHRRDDA